MKRTLAVAFFGIVFSSGCATARQYVAGGLLTTGAVIVGAGVSTGNPMLLGAGAAQIAIAAALATTPEPDPYRGTIVIRNPEPLPHAARLAYLSRGMSNDEVDRLTRALIARGWEVHAGIGRPPEATLFEIATVRGRKLISVFRPDGGVAHAKIAGGELEPALDRALADIAFRP